MYSFQKLFLETNSDSDKLHHHGYHRIYPWFISHFKNQPINLLEIGIQQTDSIKLWKSYFDDINFFGIDIDLKKFDDPTVKLYQVDQSKEEELINFTNNVGVEFDIIIDDGSHIPGHQKLTLKTFWKILKPGGVYIIEDIETSYWGKSELYGYKFDSNSINLFKSFKNCISFINNEFLTAKNKDKIRLDDLRSIFEDVEIISFGYNSVILIKKDKSSFSSFYRSEYRFDHKIKGQRI